MPIPLKCCLSFRVDDLLASSPTPSTVSQTVQKRLRVVSKRGSAIAPLFNHLPVFVPVPQSTGILPFLSFVFPRSTRIPDYRGLLFCDVASLGWFVPIGNYPSLLCFARHLVPPRLAIFANLAVSVFINNSKTKCNHFSSIAKHSTPSSMFRKDFNSSLTRQLRFSTNSASIIIFIIQNACISVAPGSPIIEALVEHCSTPSFCVS